MACSFGTGHQRLCQEHLGTGSLAAGLASAISRRHPNICDAVLTVSILGCQTLQYNNMSGKLTASERDIVVVALCLCVSETVSATQKCRAKIWRAVKASGRACEYSAVTVQVLRCWSMPYSAKCQWGLRQKQKVPACVLSQAYEYESARRLPVLTHQGPPRHPSSGSLRAVLTSQPTQAL